MRKLGPDHIKIGPVSNDNDSMERFHNAVEDALAQADIEVTPHRSSMDPRGRWDFAVIRRKQCP
jgi:hypothetical protein